MPIFRVATKSTKQGKLYEQLIDKIYLNLVPEKN